MNFRPIIIITLLFFCTTGFALNTNALKVEPPSWWVGMKNPEVQLMIYGDNIAATSPEFFWPGVSIKNIGKTGNPNYLFIDLEISETAKAGILKIDFVVADTVFVSYDYPLLARESLSAERQGFDESDIIYLVFPDRFVNGDRANDSMPGMLEKSDPSNPDSRYGGDLQGVMDKVDYMEDLGVTTLWLNPVLENNQAKYSYHGYAISDFYRVDPRMGTNEGFRQLNAMLHERGMKAVMDMVFNHCGSGHWWMSDLPSEDWINQWPEYTRSNFRGGTIFDPYASTYDQDRFQKGWFDRNMPDLNQRNPYLMNYLTQNSIWWIEYAGLDGIRMDTYPYPFKEQMAQWAGRVMSEYPNFSIVGEAWMGQPALVAPWESEPGTQTGYHSNLPYVFDFPLYDAFGQAFNEDEGWGSGIIRFYDVLTQDFLYGDEAKIVVFADNHDGDRLFSKVKESLPSQKMAMTFLLTTRGVPQIYYGTEILMSGSGSHGKMRKGFPGGFPNDESNKFVASGRNEAETEMYEHLTALTHWRNQSQLIHHGKLKHFIPENNMYVYFRYDEKEVVMVILNNDKKSQNLDLDKYAEVLQGREFGINILDKTTYRLSEMQIPAKTSFVLVIK